VRVMRKEERRRKWSGFIGCVESEIPAFLRELVRLLLKIFLIFFNKKGGCIFDVA